MPHLTLSPARIAALTILMVPTGPCLPAIADDDIDISRLPAAATEKVDFVRDIRPLFAKHCISCHGVQKQQAGLRLDHKAAALLGGDSGKVIEPGNSAQSRLVHLVAGLEEGSEMPPKGDRLTAAEIGRLRGWIDQGAAWPDEPAESVAALPKHWSWSPLARPAVPLVKNQTWVRNPIDAFVLQRLEAEQIAPSPEADRATLIRRLSFDLLGLPPSLAEVDEFLADNRPDAYEQLVDRLLASPHFGERWGRHWLDLARYADSDGYEKDTVRPFAYRYRDWVIDAINRDLPFDQFSVRQLAGDLLPDAGLDEKLAVGFHRNTLTNKEGGVDQEEYRVAATVDRVNTFGAVWLGLTVGCAQCHTHKYDPITQREYYQLFAYFNALEEVEIPAPTKAEAEQFAARQEKYLAEHAPLVAALETYERDELPGRQVDWEAAARTTTPAWTVLTAAQATAASGATLSTQADGSLVAAGPEPDKDVFELTFAIPEGNLTGLRLEVLTDERLPGKGPGRAPNGNFVLTKIDVTAMSAGAAMGVALKAVAADFEQSSHKKSPAEFPLTATLDNDDRTGWAVAPHMGRAHSAVYEFETDVTGPTTLVVRLHQQYGTAHTLGRVRVSVSSAPRPLHLQAIPDEIVRLIHKPREERTDLEQIAVTNQFKSIDPEYRQRQQAIEAHTKSAAPVITTKAQSVVERAAPRATHIHIRGDFLQKGDAVTPATLQVLHQATGPQANRLDLARWVVDGTNPLTPRVTVNHWWRHLFGQALVTTPDDFGLKGERPSHPELLDWLASELIDPILTADSEAIAWSRKRLLKLIVTSATYRQSSRSRPELTERDPRNTWLGRQNRFRFEAEIVRDASLATSGLLDRRIAGPSVRPPIPAGVAELGYAGSVKWPESQGADKYRRGLYILFQRTVPYPMLMTFDAPDSNTACLRRERSNSPLQALTLLNDPVFFECAQALGKQFVTLPDQTRLETAFRVCFARPPRSAELETLREVAAEIDRATTADPASAARIAGAAAPSEEATRLASAVLLARVLLNLDEFVVRY